MTLEAGLLFFGWLFICLLAVFIIIIEEVIVLFVPSAQLFFIIDELFIVIFFILFPSDRMMRNGRGGRQSRHPRP